MAHIKGFPVYTDNMKLKIGDQAPHFIALDQNGIEHTLDDYLGKWFVLYFYPKDNTPGCTREACNMRDSYQDLEEYAVIIGVSGDSVKSHAKFSNKHKLPFTLLADPEKIMLKSYGADGLVFNKRSSFIINPEGKLVKIYEKVNPDTHTPEIIADLKLLQS